VLIFAVDGIGISSNVPPLRTFAIFAICAAIVIFLRFLIYRKK
jgi:hypothetical protein